MKKLGAFLVGAALIFGAPAHAQIQPGNGGGGGGGGGGGSIVTPLTPGDLIAATSSTQAGDVSSVPIAAMPSSLSFTSNLTYSNSTTGCASTWICMNGLTLSGSPPSSARPAPIYAFISSDTLDAKANGGTGFEPFFFEDAVASGFTGNRSAGQFLMAAGGPCANCAASVEINALIALLHATSGQGGTNSSFTTYLGTATAFNANTFSNGSATNLAVFDAAEFDVALETGSSAARKNGFMIVETAADAVQGAYEDYALQIVNQAGAVGWTEGLVFGGIGEQWAFNTNSTLIGAVAQTLPSPATPVALNGVDFSAVTFQTGGCAYKSTGFCVDPSGNTTAPYFAAAAAGLGSISTPIFRTTANANGTGIYFPSANQIAFTVNGSQSFVSTTGAVQSKLTFQVLGGLTVVANSASLGGSSTLGGEYSGSGSTNDVTICNKNGCGSSANYVMTIATGTTTPTFPNIGTGTPATYACFDSSHNLISSATAC